MTDTPALRDQRLKDLAHRVVRHGPVSSLAEAADARGVPESQVIKTLVIRRAEDDFIFVLVPGDRTIAWPKLRSHLGVKRLSMPSADEAKDVTGYERGTITPLGATIGWPVLTDAALSGTVSLGGGAPGVSISVDIDDLNRVLEATVANVTDPV